ncbi:MAG: ABC transporter permease subunit [Saprospiraceae bacterium]|nr:ABC transporter permease subunit [Saprospiraceae bacterium]
MRSIPLTTLIPVFIAIYGIGHSPKVAIATISAALTTAFTYYVGLKEISQLRQEYFKLYKLRYIDRLKNVFLKDGVTYLLTALRLSISIALVLVIVSEMFIGTEYGLGRLVIDKSNTDDRAGMYAVILVTGVIGWLFNC